MKINKLISNVRLATANLNYLPRTLTLVWHAAPRWASIWCALLIVQGMLPAGLVYLTKLVVDSLVVALRDNGQVGSAQRAAVYVVMTAAVMLLTEVLQSAIEWVRTAQSEIVQDHIKELVHRQSAGVDIAFYESPAFYDQLDQARHEAGSRPLVLLESLGGLLQNGVTLIAMAAVLIPYGAWLPLVLFISTLPALAVILYFERRYHRWWQTTTQTRRWIQYFDVMLTHGDAAAEVRVFGLGAHFRQQYQRLRRQLVSERLKQLRRQTIYRFATAAAALCFTGSVLIWMMWRAFQGAFTLGDVALFYQAFNRGQDLMRGLLNNVGKILGNNLFLEHLFAFLELKPQVANPVTPLPTPTRIKHGIEFRKLSFRYPGSERYVFEDFSLRLEAEKITALVGINGAGKSTLFKLLCRFYDPEQGTIEIDGVDIRSFRKEDLWRLITITFQMPLNYHATVAESIEMGDLSAHLEGSQVEAAARCSGAHGFITRLPQGYDTLLGKVMADGVMLSGGEWQRLALARAYIRQAPIILLDEPTSFIDSWAEADWFSRFRELVKNNLAVVITHRFTIAMRADIIHVIDNGRIVESGAHHELLELDGLYAQSWKAQMEAGIGFGDRAKVLAAAKSLATLHDAKPCNI